VGIHIDEAVLTDGEIDISKTVPIARCGGPNVRPVSYCFRCAPTRLRKAGVDAEGCTVSVILHETS